MKKTNGEDKPEILIIADVEGWAWAHKSKQIKTHLEDEFDITIIYQFQERKVSKEILKGYDLYFTFAPRYIDMLQSVPIERRITGVTAHFLTMERDLRQKRNKVKWLHANSMLLVKEVQRYFPNCFYLPNGVNHELFKERLPITDYPFTVGHVGKPAPRKGFDRIIHPAIKDVYKSGEIKLKINQKRYRDALPLDEMANWYKDVDVMVFASDLDGTPNPMLEAAACGVPSIINRIGNAPEFIRDGINGFLIEKIGVTNYAKKIAWCRDNREKCVAMGKMAKADILDNWTWEKQSENYRNMFRTILGQM